MQACRGVVRHDPQADAAEPEILNLNGAGDQNSSLMAASAASRGVVISAGSDVGLAGLDQAGE